MFACVLLYISAHDPVRKERASRWTLFRVLLPTGSYGNLDSSNTLQP